MPNMEAMASLWPIPALNLNGSNAAAQQARPMAGIYLGLCFICLLVQEMCRANNIQPFCGNTSSLEAGDDK